MAPLPRLHKGNLAKRWRDTKDGVQILGDKDASLQSTEYKAGETAVREEGKHKKEGEITANLHGEEVGIKKRVGSKTGEENGKKTEKMEGRARELRGRKAEE